MTLYQILCLLGIPAVVGGITGAFWRKVKKYETENNAIKLGLQALLRSQMVTDYNNWNEKGYAPIYAKDNFENVWKQYEALGSNGVMSDLHNKFMALPTDPVK